MRKAKHLILIILITVMLLMVSNKQETSALNSGSDFEFYFKTQNGDTEISKADWDILSEQSKRIYLDLWVKSVDTPKVLGGFSADLIIDDKLELITTDLSNPSFYDELTEKTKYYYTDISNTQEKTLSISLNASIGANIDNFYIPLEGINLGKIVLQPDLELPNYFEVKLANISASDQFSEIEYKTQSKDFLVGEKTINPTMKSLSVIGNHSNNQYVNSENFTGVTDEEIDMTISYMDSLYGINILPTLTSPNASFEIDAINYPLTSGLVIEVTITDQTESKTYYINIIVEDPSLNNYLQSITLSNSTLTPLFDKDNNHYEVIIPYAMTSITFFATKADEKAVLKIDNQTRYTITKQDLAVGKTTTNFSVINELGEVNEYTVDIIRAEASNETKLKHLKVNGIDIYESNMDQFNYEIEESKTNFNINLSLLDNKAKLLQYSLDNGQTFITLKDNINSSSFGLNKGEYKNILIKVVAENDSEKIYTLNVGRPLSSNTEINSLKVTEGQQTTTILALNGFYSYKKSANANELYIDVLGKENSVITFNSEYMTDNRFDLSNLNEGVYEVLVIVTAQNGYTENIYTLNIIIESDQKEIEEIKILDRNNAYEEITGLVYNEQSNTYSATFDYEQISKIQLEIKASDKAIITRQSGISLSNDKTNYVTGQYDFVNSNLTGSLTLDITITAENGSTKNYKIIINRKPADTIKTLETLTINQQNIPNFVENQSPITGGYGTLLVPGDTTNINVFAAATSSKATITYNGSNNPNIALIRGVEKQVVIRVTAQDLSYYEYIVYVLAANTNNEISNIVIRNNQSQILPINFNQQTLEYELYVTYPTTSVHITATLPQNSFSKLSISNGQSGNILLNEGLNTIEVYATSESGQKGLVYSIRITREQARSNNELETLVVSSSGLIHALSPNFNPGILTYTLRVDDNVANVTVNATVLPNGSKIISGLGVHNLTSGQTTTISVVIQSESGENKTYIIEVKRANKINTLDSITIDGTTYTLENDFNQNILTLNQVNYNKLTLDTLITLADPKASFATSSNYQAGVWSLKDGQNELIITVTAQDGTVNSTKYLVRIERQAPDLTKTLSDLVLYAEGSSINLIKEFGSNKFIYEVRVNHNVTKVELIPTTTSINSKISITPKDSVTTLTLYPSNTTFIIRVYDQTEQNYNDYTIIVMRADDNNEITNISTSIQEDINFNEEITNYNLGNVLYTQNSISFDITKVSSYSSVLINNQLVSSPYLVNLKTGLNKITIQTVSEFGSKGKIYTFEVNREEASNNTNLNNLTVLNGDEILLIAETARINYVYELRVDRNISFLTINYDKSHPNQKISITPNNGGTLTQGQLTTFIIEVIAEDNVTKSYYRIAVTSKNDNHEYSDITINGLGLSTVATYDQLNNIYILNQSFTYDVNKVLIGAQKSDSYAQLTGIGERLLNNGENILEIYNTSEFGTKSDITYIKIERNHPNNDSTLDDLFVSGYEFDQTFDKNITTYNLFLDASDTSTFIDINAIIVTNLTNKKVLSGKTGIQSLPNQANFNLSFQVTVKAEDNSQTIYTINVIKQNNISTNGNLDYVIIDGVTYKLSDFTNNVLTLNDAIYSKKTLDIKVFAEDTKATVTGQIGIQEIKNIGVNTYKFKVIAQDQKTGNDIEYVIQIIKLNQNTNNTLDSLSIMHDNNELLIDFDPLVNKYEINLTTLNHEILISYIKNNQGQIVTGDLGYKNLNNGLTTFKIFVESEDGVIRTYTVNINLLSSDVTFNAFDIKLIFNGSNVLNNFNPLVAEQEILILPYHMNYVQLVIKLNNNQTLLDNNNLAYYDLIPGNTTMIEFTVKAQDGSIGQNYQIKVLRTEPETDSNLISLNVSYSNQVLDLDVNTYLHTLNLDYGTTSITFTATYPTTAVVTGLGEKSVKHGDLLIVSVVAQDNSKTDYLIKIEMYSNENTINGLRINGIDQINNFINQNYEMNVSYKMQSVHILATTNDAKATLFGTGVFTLNVGINKFDVYAVSESGVKGIIYTITVNKAKASNENELSSLSISDQLTNEVLTLSPVFNSKTTYYVIDLTTKPLIKDIFIDAVAKSIDAKIIGLGEKQLLSQQGQSSQNFMIMVYAEDNSVKVYEILVIRNINPDDDVSITEFSLIGDDGINYLGTSNATSKFSSSNKQYIVKVPFILQNVNLNIYNKNGAQSNLTGNFTLNKQHLENTTITFKMTSKTGIISENYTIIIQKELPNADSSLSQLNINGTLIKDFNPSILNYEIIVDSSKVTSLFIEAVKNNDYQVLNGVNGLKDIENGTNVFTYIVKAQDGSESTYKVTVRSLDFDNELLNLDVNTYGLDQVFDKDVLTYTLTLDYLTQSIEIEGYANQFARVEGIGIKNLNIGLNVFEIYVMSQGATKGVTYKINVTRNDASGDNLLETLVIKESLLGNTLNFNPMFNKNTLHYTLTIPSDKNLNTLYIEAKASSIYATVSGTGVRVLEALVTGDYHTILEVTVMAQNGEVNTYTLSIYRAVDLSTDISLLNILLTDNLGNTYLTNQASNETLFDKDILFYEIFVPYHITSMNLTVLTNRAKTYGTGIKNFGVNDELRYDFYIVSEDGSVTSSNYIIHITRIKALHANDLEGIYINDMIIDHFDKDTLSYDVIIQKQLLTSINLSAKALDQSTTISGDLGIYQLNDGKNMFVINALAQNGVLKTYTVNISYVDSNALLENLIIRGTTLDKYDINNSELISFEFDSNQLNYKIRVDESIKLVHITGNAIDQIGAQIMGFGTYEVTSIDKEVIIYVRSADYKETITYKVVITNKRIPSANTELAKVLINGVEVLLNSDGFTYKINLDNQITSAQLTIEAGSIYSKVRILNDYKKILNLGANNHLLSGEITSLNQGLNVVIIEVEAEDGTKQMYQISMFKEQNSNELVVLVLITMMLLWLGSMTYLFIKRNHKNIYKQSKYLVKTRREKERD